MDRANYKVGDGDLEGDALGNELTEGTSVPLVTVGTGDGTGEDDGIDEGVSLSLQEKQLIPMTTRRSYIIFCAILGWL